MKDNTISSNNDAIIPLSAYFKKKKLTSRSKNIDSITTQEDGAEKLNETIATNEEQTRINDKTTASSSSHMINFQTIEELNTKESPSFCFSFQMEDSNATTIKKKKKRIRRKRPKRKESQTEHEDKNGIADTAICHSVDECKKGNDNTRISDNMKNSHNNLVFSKDNEKKSNYFQKADLKESQQDIGSPSCHDSNNNTTTVHKNIIKNKVTKEVNTITNNINKNNTSINSITTKTPGVNKKEPYLNQNVNKSNEKEIRKQKDSSNTAPIKTSPKIKLSPHMPKLSSSTNTIKILKSSTKISSQHDAKKTVNNTNTKKNKQQKPPSFSLSSSDKGAKAVINKTGMILHKQQKQNKKNILMKEEERRNNSNTSSSPCNAFSFGFDFQFS